MNERPILVLPLEMHARISAGTSCACTAKVAVATNRAAAATVMSRLIWFMTDEHSRKPAAAKRR